MAEINEEEHGCEVLDKVQKSCEDVYKRQYQCLWMNV